MVIMILIIEKTGPHYLVNDYLVGLGNYNVGWRWCHCGSQEQYFQMMYKNLFLDHNRRCPLLNLNNLKITKTNKHLILLNLFNNVYI